MAAGDAAALRDALRGHLARGSLVQLSVDARAAGVRLPDTAVVGAPDGIVVLEYGPDHRLGTAIHDLHIGDDGVTATLSFGRLPAATFVPWAAVRGLVADAPRPAVPRCALCGRARAEVAQLVAGDDGAVCDACVPLALSVLDGDPAASPRWRHLLACVDVMLGDLAPRTPHAASAPLFAAARALAAGDPAWSRTLLVHARRLDQPAIALAIVDDLPQGARTFGDRIERFSALMALERFAEASAEVDGIDDTGLGEPQLAVLAIDRAVAAAAVGGEHLARVEPNLAIAEALISRLGPAAQTLLALAMLARAQLLLARGEPVRAAAMLADSADRNLVRLRLLGDALAAAGRTDEARARWAEALAAAHPESPLAASLRRRLGEPER